MKKLFILLGVVTLLFDADGQVQRSDNVLSIGDAPLPGATINDIAWIQGYWQGELLGGNFEEIWSAPSNGTMMGSFKLMMADSVFFYEILVIAEENNTLTLRLKHFHNDLRGWEEKDEYVKWPLVKIEENRIYFDGLTFEKMDKDHIRLYLLMKSEDGIMREETTVYNRVSF